MSREPDVIRPVVGKHGGFAVGVVFVAFDHIAGIIQQSDDAE